MPTIDAPLAEIGDELDLDTRVLLHAGFFVFAAGGSAAVILANLLLRWWPAASITAPAWRPRRK